MCGKPKVLYRLNMVVQECIRNPPNMPDFLPDRLESGTPNLMGIGGLIGGIQYIQNRGIDDINRQEIALTERFLTGLETMDHITIYGPERGMPRVPVVSINVGNLSPQKTSEFFGRKSGNRRALRFTLLSFGP